MSKDDSEPAFPQAHDWSGTPGMSLRKYYAGEALVGALSNSEHLISFIKDTEKKGKDVKQRLAKSCYAIADAMIEEGKKETDS